MKINIDPAHVVLFVSYGFIILFFGIATDWILTVGVMVIMAMIFIISRIITGDWLPNGSLAGMHSPSGINWKSVNEAIKDGEKPENIFSSEDKIDKYRYTNRKKHK